MDKMTIQSLKGPYEVLFQTSVADAARAIGLDRPYHCIVDSHVLDLHRDGLAELVSGAISTVEIEATENNKSLENMTLIGRLSDVGVKRDHLLVAIGGGIIQDLTCFAASILFRGMDWAFLPTTLLAQADSCIGSKSSINAAGTKNLVGTFHAPTIVSIASDFLGTLDPRDVHSGVGEMLKVHIIDGPASFDRLAAAYDGLFTDSRQMLVFIHASLEIKKKLIEIDEFDRGPRNVMNYGHSFGHAIEAATDFAVPHGIGVSLGADMANYVAVQLGRMEASHYGRMHLVLLKNYTGFETTDIPLEPMLTALGRDKKNFGGMLTLILPDSGAVPRKVQVPATDEFKQICKEYLQEKRMQP
jgi:3-dehydroquinate synthase